MAIAQAPERQTRLTPITPVIGDLLVSITKEYQRKDIPEYGTEMHKMHSAATPDNRFKDHVFIFAAPQDNAREDLFTCYFAAPRENQDEYNWEVTEADIGGNKFDAISRTYIIPREDYDKSDPAMGSAMPDVPAGKFTSPTTYILAVKSQRRTEQEFDSYFVVETRVFVRKASIRSLGSDPLNGRPLVSISTIYHRSEIVTGVVTAAALFADPTNAYWGTQSDGYIRTGRQLSTEFYEIVNEQAVNAPGGVVHDYFTTEDFYWPGVFGGVRLYDYELRNGGTEIYAEPYLSKEAYRGPCKARVQLFWSSTEFTLSVPEVMLPLPITANTPFFSYSLGPTLHTAGSYNVVTGSHPKYSLNVGTAAEWEATTPTDWPATIRAVDEQKPYRGGWLRTLVTIYQPTYG